MHAAARTGHAGAAYLLHYAGANLDVTDNYLRTPLASAILGMCSLQYPFTASVGKDGLHIHKLTPFSTATILILSPRPHSYI